MLCIGGLRQAYFRYIANRGAVTYRGNIDVCGTVQHCDCTATPSIVFALPFTVEKSDVHSPAMITWSGGVVHAHVW